MTCAAHDCNQPVHPDRYNPKKRYCSKRCASRMWMRNRRRTDPEFRERDNERCRDYFARLEGMDYAKRQLRVRRNMAKLRRRRRSLGASRPEGHKEG